VEPYLIEIRRLACAKKGDGCVSVRALEGLFTPPTAGFAGEVIASCSSLAFVTYIQAKDLFALVSV
jgi:hypothetical protein